MKLYNKPELNVEKFDVDDVMTVSTGQSFEDVELEQVAGMEFDISANGNEF